ncbi:MAG: GGDEF domain-containing protein [Usitatibacter sp.]
MTAIVRLAVVVVTIALFFGTSFNAFEGHRDIAILMALATPLGISALGFARAGHNEAAIALLCCVLITVVTMVLFLNPLGVHDVALTAYGGIVVIAALLLSRRAFIAILVLTLVSATAAFAADLLGFSRSEIGHFTHWTHYLDFAMITLIFAILGRYASEKLFASLGEAHYAATRDLTTGLLNRHSFFDAAGSRLRHAHSQGDTAVLVVADIDAFRRLNLVIGHAAADGLLAEVALRLTEAAGDGECLVGRVGDDEFAVLGMGLPEDLMPNFARALHDSVNFNHEGVSLRSAAGYSRFPRDAHTIESLMLGAQSGVEAAKGRAEGRVSGPADRI